MSFSTYLELLILIYNFFYMYLIENLDGPNKYKITEKGLNYLKMHNKSRELLPGNTIKND